MQISHWRASRRKLVAVAAIGVTAISALGAAQSASATKVDWLWTTLTKDGTEYATAAGDSYPNFRVSHATADLTSHTIEVGAHLPGGWTLYGSYVAGMGNACHTYAGTSTLGGIVHNPHTVAVSPVAAYIRYNESTTC